MYIFIYFFIRAFVDLCICVWMYLCVYGKPQMFIYVFVLLCKYITNSKYFFTMIIFITR